MLQSFILGILASLSPCTIVLIPVFLYRFGLVSSVNHKTLYKDLVLSLIGFLVSLIFVGLFFNILFTSVYVNVFRFIVGGGLIVLGFLQLFGIYTFSSKSKINNPFLFGLFLPWFISFSPCVIPFFALTLSSGLVTGEIIVDILLFGLGVLAPSFFVAIIGDRFMALLKKSRSIMTVIEKYSGILIILAGIYLNFQIIAFEKIDLYFVLAFMLVLVAFAIYIVFIKHKLISIANILMFASMFIIVYIMFFNCKSSIYNNHLNELLSGKGFRTLNYNNQEDYQCSHLDTDCEVCRECANLFSVSVVLGSIGFIFSYNEKKRRKIKL